MNAQQKIDKVLAHIEGTVATANPEQARELVAESNAKERDEFTSVLIDNLKTAKIGYYEAVARAKIFAKTATDLSMIMARIGEYEVPLSKSASIANSTMEVHEMGKGKNEDKTKQAIDKLKAKLPKYGAWLESLLKKEGWYMGTGSRINMDEYDIGAMEEDNKRNAAEVTEGEKLEKEHAKEREEARRASHNQAVKTGEKREQELRESKTVGVGEYDNGAAADDDKRWHSEVKEGDKLMNEHA